MHLPEPNRSSWEHNSTHGVSGGVPFPPALARFEYHPPGKGFFALSAGVDPGSLNRDFPQAWGATLGVAINHFYALKLIFYLIKIANLLN